MSNIWMNSTSGQSKLIASNLTSYLLSSTDYPGWIWNQSSVQIVVEVQSNSEFMLQIQCLLYQIMYLRV